MPVTSIELPKDGELHKTILEALVARKRFSEMRMQDHYQNLEEMDKMYELKVRERSADRMRKAKKKQGEQEYVDIEVPYAYAMMMSAHTYLATTFLSRDPILQFEGRHGEPQQMVQAVEAYMSYNTRVGGHMGPYYAWLLDVVKYGFGVIGVHWDREVNHIAKTEEVPVTVDGVPLVGKYKTVKTVERLVGYEGNRLFNVRPYDYLPDPRVPLAEPQKGEFAGRKVSLAWNTVLRGKDSGQYINTEGLKDMARKKQDDKYQSRWAAATPNESSDYMMADHSIVAPLDGFEMVVELSPKEWKLGSSEYPEKWVFTVIDDARIIEAHPLGAYHNMFPFEVIESEYDPYSMFKRGVLEHGQPINDIISWLFNSHFYNVRKTLNGDIIYDPSKVFSKDLLEPGPGRKIRLRPEAMGEDVRTAVHTLSGGADVTGTHMRDAQVAGELMQRVTGVSDNLMGALHAGGRKTATEVRTASTSSVNRLRTMAEYISATGFTPLAQQMLGNARQYYSDDKKFRLAGDFMTHSEGFVNVTPETLAGTYDFSPVDGTLPVDRFAQVNMWVQMMAQIQRFPQILEQYDMGRIFAWVAQLGGLKNIQQFRIHVSDNPEGVGLDELSGQPSPGGRGGSGASSPGGTRGRSPEQGPTNPIPSQIPGMGPSG